MENMTLIKQFNSPRLNTLTCGLYLYFSPVREEGTVFSIKYRGIYCYCLYGIK